MITDFVVNGEVLVAILAMVASLVFNYFPKVRVWFAGLASEAKAIGELACDVKAMAGFVTNSTRAFPSYPAANPSPPAPSNQTGTRSSPAAENPAAGTAG